MSNRKDKLRLALKGAIRITITFFKIKQVIDDIKNRK
jgi:hypothetical protein